MYKLKQYDPRKFKSLRPSRKKDLRYWQTDLKPLGDFDKDNKVNIIDCFPYDPDRQGISDIIKKPVEKVKEKIKEIKEYKEERKEFLKTHKYVIAQQEDGKWVNLGAVKIQSDIQAKEIIKKAQSYPNIKKAILSEDPKKAEKLNRIDMYESIEGGVEKVLTKGYEGAKKVKEELTRIPKTEKMSAFAQGPSTPTPPPTRGWYGSWGGAKPEKISVPRPTRYPVNIKTQDLEEQGIESSEDFEGRPREEKFSYLNKSPFYQRRSSFYNYDSDMETCVPYRPVGYYQVFAPYRPFKRNVKFVTYKGFRRY